MREKTEKFLFYKIRQDHNVLFYLILKTPTQEKLLLKTKKYFTIRSKRDNVSINPKDIEI